MRTNGLESFCASKTMLERCDSHSYQRQSKKSMDIYNRRSAQNRLQVSNPYDSNLFFYLDHFDLFRICQQPFERVTSLNVLNVSPKITLHRCTGAR